MTLIQAGSWSVSKKDRLVSTVAMFSRDVCFVWRPISEVPITQLPRSHSIGRRESAARLSLKILLDHVFLKFLERYSTKPLYFFGSLGFASIAVSLFVFSVAVLYKVSGQDTFIETPLPLLTAYCFLTGVLQLVLRIKVELLTRIYQCQVGNEFYEIQDQ